MVVMAVAGREATRELTVFQVLGLRSVRGLALLWSLIQAAGAIPAMKTLRLPQDGARNVVHDAARYGWFVALTLIPLARVVALEFTMPIWSAALAVAFLGERMNRWKVLAVALGLAGLAVIVRPAATGLDPGRLVALAAAVGFAVSVVLVKSLTRTDKAIQVGGTLDNSAAAHGLRPLCRNMQPCPHTSLRDHPCQILTSPTNDRIH